MASTPKEEPSDHPGVSSPQPTEPKTKTQQPLSQVAEEGHPGGLADTGNSQSAQEGTTDHRAASATPIDALSGSTPASGSTLPPPSLVESKSAAERPPLHTAGESEDLIDLEDSKSFTSAEISNTKGTASAVDVSRLADDVDHTRAESASQQDEDGNFSDSDDAASVFSQASLASTATSLGGVVGASEELVSNLTSVLLCNEDVNPISITAIRDPGIGTERFRRNIRRLIKAFGQELRAEAKSSLQMGTAHALQTRRISTQAACELVTRTKALFDDGKDTTRTPDDAPSDDEDLDGHAVPDDQDMPSDASVDSANEEDDEEDDGELKVDQELTQVREFLLGSEAYASLKGRLLDFAHRPYEMRISEAIGNTAIDELGETLHPDDLKLIVEEISWVPTRLFVFLEPGNVRLSLGDRLKGFVEGRAGHRVNWWPLSPRLHPLGDEFCRLQWSSPCGTVRHIDIQWHTRDALEAAFKSAPTFLDQSTPPSAEHLEQLYVKLGYKEPPMTYFLSLAKFMGLWKSPQIIYSSLALNNGYQKLLNEPSPVALAAGISSAYPAPLATIHPQLQHPNSSQHLNTPTVFPAGSTEPRYLYLCIRLRTSRFKRIRCDTLSDDDAFFAALKSAYDVTRRPFRRWFSIWQYDRCDFYQFKKFGVNGSSLLDIGFPSTDDVLYEFKPRPPLSVPPLGPISAEQFSYHYYYPCVNAWPLLSFQRSHAAKNTQPGLLDNEALDSLPKCTLPLDMEDGRPQLFYGLLAVERLCPCRIALYVTLLFSPWLVFPPLWMFVWGHPGDLQNAFVPLTVLAAVMQIVDIINRWAGSN